MKEMLSKVVELTDEQRYALIDTGAFNNIIKGYMSAYNDGFIKYAEAFEEMDAKQAEEYYMQQYYFDQEYDPGTDQQLGKYDVEVMNGDGHYNSDGMFVRHRDPDARPFDL